MNRIAVIEMSVKKKLLYRSLHRGCKELDIILGNFAYHNIDKLSDKEIDEYEKIINLEDNDLYNYLVLNKKTFDLQTISEKLLKDIVNFNISLSNS